MSATPSSMTPAGPPQGAPPRSSNAIWWVLGIFGAAIMIVIVGGIVTAGYFVRNIHVDEKAQKLEVSTPAGKVTLHATDSVKTVGLPIYPGAELAESGGGIEVTAPNDKSVAVTGVSYRTPDSPEKVDAWYRAQLGPDFERHLPGERPGKWNIQGVDLEKGDIAYIAEGEGLMRIVAIKKISDGTKIGMARLGKQESQ
jgi:hypothetical protein